MFKRVIARYTDKINGKYDCVFLEIFGKLLFLLKTREKFSKFFKNHEIGPELQ
jgi:hypothetical protein